MTINQRIRELRKSMSLTQTDFGQRIGLKHGAVSKMEQDGNTITDQNVRLICDTFHVREHWLRTGEGPKEAEDGSVWLKKLADEYRLTGEHAGLIDAWLKLKPEQRQSFIDAAKALIAGAEAARKEDAPTHVDIDQELSDYETELKAQAEEQSPSAGTSATGKRA